MKDKVANCAAVGVPHEVFTEGVMAFVEKKPGAELTVEELMAHAKEIAGYMRPSHYKIIEAGEFPLNRVAKTDYVVIKERAKKIAEELRSKGGWDS